MANRDFNEVKAPETDTVILTGTFTGADGADGTACTGCIVSAHRSAEGVYDVVLQDAYPAFLFHTAKVTGSAGDNAQSHTAVSGSKTIKVSAWTVAGVADDCDAKVIALMIVARNSTSRRAT
jgi:hypothetical protein